jgi:hypothetical protein
MSSETFFWQSVERLLLAFTFDLAIAQLNPIICNLTHEFPSKKVSFLFSQPSGYLLRLAEKTSILYPDLHGIVGALAKPQFEAAIIFTEPHQSPYSLAYLSYLAGIPVRIGQSCEFGGGVLSRSIEPPPGSGSSNEYHRHLLCSIGLLHSTPSPSSLIL